MKITVNGGAKLAAALNKIAANVAKSRQVDIGFFENATYADGLPVAAVANWNEFGTATIPPRPFMRKTAKDGEKSWGKLAGAALKQSDMDAEKALTICGRMIQVQMQDNITEGGWVDNAPSTIRQKGFNKPLIGKTRTLLNSVTFKVQE